MDPPSPAAQKQESMSLQYRPKLYQAHGPGLTADVPEGQPLQGMSSFLSHIIGTSMQPAQGEQNLRLEKASQRRAYLPEQTPPFVFPFSAEVNSLEILCSCDDVLIPRYGAVGNSVQRAGWL